MNNIVLVCSRPQSSITLVAVEGPLLHTLHAAECGHATSNMPVQKSTLPIRWISQRHLILQGIWRYSISKILIVVYVQRANSRAPRVWTRRGWRLLVSLSLCPTYSVLKSRRTDLVHILLRLWSGVLVANDGLNDLLANDIDAIHSNRRPATPTKPSLRYLNSIGCHIWKVVEYTICNGSRPILISWTLPSSHILYTAIIQRLIFIYTSLLPLVLVPPPIFFDALSP